MLQKQLLEIASLESGRKELRSSALAGAKLVQKNIRAEAPKGPTRNLRKGIVAKAFKSRSGFPEASFVQATAPHSHLIEEGTDARTNPNRWGRGPGSTGQVKPNPFFSRGVLRSQSDVAKIMTDSIEKTINDLVK